MNDGRMVPPPRGVPWSALPSIAAGDARSGRPGDEAAEVPGVSSMQHPLMGVVPGDVASDEFDQGRQAAALELVAGLERAISSLHACDVEERAWFQARLREARLMAGLAPLELAGTPHGLSGVRSA